MKKLVLIILCLVLALSGCAAQKAEPYYPDMAENVEFEAEFEYYFDDETNIFCLWTNNTEKDIFFQDAFQLHELGDNGEWYVVGNPEEAEFNLDYAHFVEPGEENVSKARYGISLYSSGLDEGKTYRISTYCYDSDDNRYQVYAEFICDNSNAESEMLELSDGMFGDREKEYQNGEFELLDKKD